MMAFPWSRRDTDASPPTMRRRRRNGLWQARRDEAAQETRHLSQEQLHQRLSWAIGAVLILVVTAVIAAGYYQKFYRPPRAWAGQVRDVRFTMGDLVQRIRVQQGITGTVDLTSDPFDYLQGLMDSEILRQEAGELGIRVTEAMVEQELRSRFYPAAPGGQVTDPGQLDQEYRNNFQIFLTRTGLSAREYRGIVAEQLQSLHLYFILGRDIPQSMEQVEVEWIRLEVRGRVIPAGVVDRFRTESFAAVAQDVSVPAGFAGPSGYVGWVPRQAFPQIGRTLFGDERTGLRPLGIGDISRPLFTPDGIYIIHKLSGPETRPLSRQMRDQVNVQSVIDWQKESLRQGTQQGYVKIRFNSDLYSWVADQVEVSAPRNRPELR